MAEEQVSLFNDRIHCSEWVFVEFISRDFHPSTSLDPEPFFHFAIFLHTLECVGMLRYGVIKL